MRAALLNTQPLIDEWFQRDYSEVQVCGEVNETFLSAEIWIITAFYEVEGRTYQVLELWRKFMERDEKAKSKKLCVLGWTDSSSPNYLRVGAMPENFEEASKKMQRAGQKPPYSSLADQDIIPSLDRMLETHGVRALRKLVISIRSSLLKVEKLIQKDSRRRGLETEEVFQETDLAFKILGKTWQDRLPYFSLMPQFAQLDKCVGFIQAWKKMGEYPYKLPDQALSDQLSDYLKGIRRICGLYKMDAKK